jgi:hypothetical protein
MKRDMDLARKILLELEQAPSFNQIVELKGIFKENYSKDQVYYHVMLLAQAGLIDANEGGSFQESRWFPLHLTWEGHDFLEAAKDNARWQKAKKIMREKGGGIVFEVLKTLLVNLMKSQVLDN